jgi:hypothetical protein
MRARGVALAVGLFALAASIAGCGGSSTSFAPQAATAPLALPLQLSHVRGNAQVTLPKCTARAAKVPGAYTLLAAAGTVNGSTFTGNSGISIWVRAYVPKGNTPAPVVDIPSGKIPYKLWYGSYKLKSGLVGCFYLVGAKYPEISYTGAGAGWPNVRNYGDPLPIDEGPLVISIKGLSTTGGSGTVVLNDAATGKAVDSGTIVIVGRKTGKG